MVPFKPYFLGQETPPYDARRERAEVRAHPRHRGGRQDHPARHVLPDVRQLLLRRLLQGRRDRARLGAGHQAAGRRRLRLRGGAGSAPPSTTTTTRRSSSGRRSPACPTSGSCGSARRRTTGPWACPGPGGPCSEILYDRGPEYGPTEGGPECRRARTATWRSGTSSSCRTSSARSAARTTSTSPARCPSKNIDTGMGLERVALLLQGVDNIYEIDEIFPVIERAERAVGPPLRRGPRRTTCGCGSSPTTCAAR